MAEQQDVNIMITNVSVINRYLKNEYTDESGQYADITGYITNEAPVKYLMQKLNATDEKLDKLILLPIGIRVSKEVKGIVIIESSSNKIKASLPV